MKDFRFSVPQNICFGMGSLQQLPQIVKNGGLSRVMIVSDEMLEALGLVGKIETALTEAGISSSKFLEIRPNPTVAMVDAALKAYQESKAEGIIALGGGSPMDVAKAVAVLAKYGGSITEYEGAHKVPGAIVPIVAIPTTAGTGSEVTAFSVIVDEARHYKLTVFSYELIPKYAILDPQLVMTAPPLVAAACGIDAMIHALEAYLSRDASPFSDAMAEKALELIGKNLRQFVACRQNPAAAEAMVVASNFAGIAFAWARLGNVHAMSHPVSAFFGVPHGVANAILLPTIVEYNAIADHDGKYERIYNFIRGCKEPAVNFRPQQLVEEIRSLNQELGIPAHLAEVGVTEDKIPQMAADAMKSGNIMANPRSSAQKDIEALYRKAM